jgi:hypothetical protein
VFASSPAADVQRISAEADCCGPQWPCLGDRGPSFTFPGSAPGQAAVLEIGLTMEGVLYTRSAC